MGRFCIAFCPGRTPDGPAQGKLLRRQRVSPGVQQKQRVEVIRVHRAAIVWQIDQCRQLGLSHLYLGYWIAQSPKMAYKAGYRPLEYLRQGRWETEPPPDALPTDISG